MVLHFRHAEYSEHALERMRVRRVSRRHVGIAIRDPDSSYEDVESDALVAVKKYGRWHVVVIFTSSGERVKVITVYHSSDVDRLISRKLQRKAWLVTR